MIKLHLTKSSFAMVAGLALAAILVGACSSAATPAPAAATPAPAAATPAPAAATPAPAAATPAPAAGTATVMSKTLGSQTVLVAGSNGMTVYTFTSDTAGSGTSACSGACLTKWPALTVAAGATPTPGDGVTGKLGTITRADDGTLQVTYNGLPLYFYQGDKAPGDTNGSYPNWNLVKP
jgi:predicted lipoprotein with Yx(FWY)xxD motif